MRQYSPIKFFALAAALFIFGCGEPVSDLQNDKDINISSDKKISTENGARLNAPANDNLDKMDLAAKDDLNIKQAAVKAKEIVDNDKVIY
ncbi:hypothetical protein LPB140_07870 [Sphingorhabdus lutea]|uniref:Lipoprotein n=1 Tax=Sphingorhabdus lutea TaxID=1913578 RepID=A0A1L3JC76_9SPHN|nr:hypothetical protein [Sphingorhabdus lutea]APG62722.1 hypothetical protein LPB140_07870 [Sphingorhabdus lutea]